MKVAPWRSNPVFRSMASRHPSALPVRRTLVLAATLLLLWFLVAEANHLLAGLRVYLYPAALFVVHAALTQPARSGLAATLLGGLIFDAHAPAPLFGLHLILFAAAHAVVFHLRDRIPRDDTVAVVVVALLVNFALFLMLSFWIVPFLPVPATAWGRLLMDLLVSQFVVALAAPWYFALQSRALLLAGVEREGFA